MASRLLTGPPHFCMQAMDEEESLSPRQRAQHPTACRVQYLGDEGPVELTEADSKQTKRPTGPRPTRKDHIVRISPSLIPVTARPPCRASHLVPFFLVLPEIVDKGRTNPKQPVHNKSLHPRVTDGVLEEVQDLSWQLGSFLA